MTNPITGKLLLWASRTKGNFVKRLVGILLNSDIFFALPKSTCLPHPYGIVIHSGATIGENVTILHQVTIGGRDVHSKGVDVAPHIGDGVIIGAGAKILGPIRVGHNAKVGANAVVTKDVPDGATVVGFNRILDATRTLI